MRLWRLSRAEHASAFNGGYGLSYDGRWNTVGHAVTYAATSPALCVLEKLVHIEDPELLPKLVMVQYEAPDELGMQKIELSDLPSDWASNMALTQSIGDAWHEAGRCPLLQVPSVIVALNGSPDMNVLINNFMPDASRITIVSQTPFTLDGRLL